MTAEIASHPPLKVSWIIGTLAAFSIFALIGIYSMSMARNSAGFEQMRAQDRLARLAKVRADADKNLTTADWVDPTKQTIRIPIDEAMDREIDTLKNKPLAMGALIPGATPPPPPAPATTNAAPAPPAKPNP